MARNQEKRMTPPMTSSENPENPQKRRRRSLLLGLLAAVLVLAVVTLRPGFFVVQPIGAVPDGVTIFYLSRGENLNFVESADGMCLRMQGGVNLLCRGIAMAKFIETYEDEIVVRLPYSEWMYAWTTDGAYFDR